MVRELTVDELNAMAEPIAAAALERDRTPRYRWTMGPAGKPVCVVHAEAKNSLLPVQAMGDAKRAIKGRYKIVLELSREEIAIRANERNEFNAVADFNSRLRNQGD